MKLERLRPTAKCIIILAPEPNQLPTPAPEPHLTASEASQIFVSKQSKKYV